MKLNTIIFFLICSNSNECKIYGRMRIHSSDELINASLIYDEQSYKNISLAIVKHDEIKKKKSNHEIKRLIKRKKNWNCGEEMQLFKWKNIRRMSVPWQKCILYKNFARNLKKLFYLQTWRVTQNEFKLNFKQYITYFYIRVLTKKLNKHLLHNKKVFRFINHHKWNIIMF